MDIQSFRAARKVSPISEYVEEHGYEEHEIAYRYDTDDGGMGFIVKTEWGWDADLAGVHGTLEAAEEALLEGLLQELA